MKRKLLVLLSLAVLFSMTILSFGLSYDQLLKNKVTVKVNGEVLNTYDSEQGIDLPGVIYNGRTMLPLRKMMEVFDLQDSTLWDPSNRSIKVITEDGRLIWLQIDNLNVQIDGVDKALDVPATIINNRTYVPVRFISEAMNIVPSWDGETRTVGINVNEMGNISISRSILKKYDLIQKTDTNKYFIADTTGAEKYFTVEYRTGSLNQTLESVIMEENIGANVLKPLLNTDKRVAYINTFKDVSGLFDNHLVVANINGKSLVYELKNMTSNEVKEIIEKTY